ncbi:MAG: response regulator, partial [Clostridiaceae bacterium]|nr:response regulator [Clostridiaceae bacterium]
MTGKNMDNKLIKVMIVDDESLIRIGLKSTIDWQKYNMKVICEAASGDAAYEMFLEQKPDLVFTDIRMPKRDGIWLTRMIRQRDIETPIIVLTCYDEFAYVREALRAGANEYMLKSEVEQEKMDQILNEMMLLCNTLKHRKNGKLGAAENIKSFRKGGIKAEFVSDGNEPAYELNDDEMFELIFTEEATEEIKREIWG